MRELGQALGIASESVWRHPFPGPGLAIRVLGEITRDRLAILRHADDIMIQEITAAGVYKDIGQVRRWPAWKCSGPRPVLAYPGTSTPPPQAFVVLLPVKSVGVMGDCRTYEQVGLGTVRPRTPVDATAATAHAHAPCAILGRRIVFP